MAWYDSATTGIVAIGTALAGLVGVLGNALMKARRDLARHNSEIKVEKSDAKGASWVVDQLMTQVTRAEAARDSTIEAARKVFLKHEEMVEKVARLEEKLANAKAHSDECEARAQRAESRVVIAEERMVKQTEQILLMGINIDQLTTKLAEYDKDAAVRMAPRLKQQALLAPEERTIDDEQS